jgi:hypothetical protein
MAVDLYSLLIKQFCKGVCHFWGPFWAEGLGQNAPGPPLSSHGFHTLQTANFVNCVQNIFFAKICAQVLELVGFVIQ